MSRYLSILRPPVGSRKRVKRVGRGVGSGHGRTACRGTKGQNSRSGGGVSPGFEGGQMPLHRRLPKRGFVNIFKREFEIVNLRQLEQFEEGSTINPDLLVEKGIIKDYKNGVKVLGDGELTKRLTVIAHSFSKSAKEKIEKVGGKVIILN